MSRVENQRRLFLELMHELRSGWYSDLGQPRHLAQWLAQHRAGSRDRKLYRELAYTAWRTIPDLDQLTDEDLVQHVATHAESNPATAAFIDEFGVKGSSPELAAPKVLPTWLAEQSPSAAQSPHLESLLQRAPLWIRIQTESPQSVGAEFGRLGIKYTPSELIPSAWKLAQNAPVQSTQAFRSGLFEIQDIGSQSLLHSLTQPLNGRWLDACAGAGGKTLQLAQLLGDSGDVTAHDVRFAALQELEKRVRRAGLNNVSIETEPSGAFDGVLVDAPCTGSGTWRRAPHLKWTTSLDRIQKAASIQLELLEQFSRHVAPNGLLVYATCSLCRSENEDVVDAFASDHSEFTPEPLIEILSQQRVSSGRLTRLPADLDSDAFFVAAFRRQ